MANKIEVDALTGVEIITELTPEEISEREELALQIQAQQESREAARISALAKLAALGLTEEEIAAL
jgi:hypothetical protein